MSDDALKAPKDFDSLEEWWEWSLQRFTDTNYRHIYPNRLDYIITGGQRYYANPPAPEWKWLQWEYDRVLDSLDTTPRK